MDSKQLFPICKLELVEWRDDLDAGVAHQDVDAAIGLDHLSHAGLDLLLLRHVHGNTHGSGTGVVERSSSSLSTFQVEIGDGDARALAHIGGCDLLADTARCASDDGDLVFQTHDCSPCNYVYPNRLYMAASQT